MDFDNSYIIKLNNRLKSILPPKTNVALAVADLLDISKEGAYRRLRGDTSFGLRELLTLRRKLGISIDELIDGTESVNFSFKPLYGKPLALDDYFSDIAIRFKKLSHIERSMTYNVCEDLPFFRQFKYTHLSCFKLFYWRHSILLDPNYATLKYDREHISEETLALASNVQRLYHNIPSTEIWTERTLKNTLRQIEYFHDCGLFKSQESIQNIYLDLISLMKDLINEARISVKMDDNQVHKGSFNLHLCELSLDSNSIFLETKEPNYLATGFNSFNSLQTMDARLLREYRSWLSAMISKSTTISGQAERIRYDFYTNNFNAILKSAEGRLDDYALKLLLAQK